MLGQRVQHISTHTCILQNCQGREGPIFFGEDYYGYTLSYMFIIKDTQARGLQRGYSIIVVMMDKIYLLNSWPFLVKHMKSLIDELKSKSNKVHRNFTFPTIFIFCLLTLYVMQSKAFECILKWIEFFAYFGQNC